MTTVYCVTTYRDGHRSEWYPGLARNRRWSAERRARMALGVARLADDLAGSVILFATFYLAMVLA